VKMSHFWFSYAFLGAIVPFIWLLDRKMDVNYMFLMTPTDDSPLKWVSDITGDKLYLVGLLLLLTGVLAVVYLAEVVVRRRHAT